MLKEKIRIIDQYEDLPRGSIFRCKGSYPYEDVVDFMLIELPAGGERSYALLVISGYKAGMFYSYLPQESIPLSNEGYALQIDWIKENWHKWGYFECDLKDVYLINNVAPLDFYN